MTASFLEKDPAFWRKVAISLPTTCWLWMGAKKPKGYGNVSRNGKWTTAHRHAWSLRFGPIPDGMQVQHSCDTPSCCNPYHLMLGTVISNYVDMAKKGRSKVDHLNRLSGEKHPNSKLTSLQVHDIRLRYSAGRIKQADLAKEFCVSQRTISLITRNEVRIHG